MKTTITIEQAKAYPDQKITVSEHFRGAAELYHTWSPIGHLHFGFWKIGICPWKRAAMLDEMVEQVYSQIKTDGASQYFADLGCGYGSAARQLVREHGARVDAYTIIDQQIEEGDQRAASEGLLNRVNMLNRDFRRTLAEDAHYDGVYAMESLCYASGVSKIDVLEEIHRILKPGAKLSLTDGFILVQPPESGLRNKVLQNVTEGWAVGQLRATRGVHQCVDTCRFCQYQGQRSELSYCPVRFPCSIPHCQKFYRPPIPRTHNG